MIAGTRLALALGTVSDEFFTRLESLLLRAGLPTSYAGHADLFDLVRRALQLDKKFREGRNVFVLPTGIGQWEQRENVPWELVDDAIRGALA
jgi:3-dehydroquinate synthase